MSNEIFDQVFNYKKSNLVDQFHSELFDVASAVDLNVNFKVVGASQVSKPSTQFIAGLEPNVVGHNLLETMVPDLQSGMIVDSPNVIHGGQFVDGVLLSDSIMANSFLAESTFVNPRHDNFYGDSGLVIEPDYSLISGGAQFPEKPVDVFENIFEFNPIIVPFDDFAIEKICYSLIDIIHKLIYSDSPLLTLVKLTVIAYLILETFSLFSPRFGGSRQLPR